jgi:hypothetical protein
MEMGNLPWNYLETKIAQERFCYLSLSNELIFLNPFMLFWLILAYFGLFWLILAHFFE